MLLLKKLKFAESARFRDLKIEGVTTDHLTYHINTLLKSGFVLKDEEANYTLSKEGKQFVGRMEDETATIEQQGKRCVLVRITKFTKDNQKEYLLNKRLKQPFFGYYGFHTGKVRQGEAIMDAAKRELLEETGLRAKLHLAGITHYIDYSKEGELVRDIYFYVLNGYDPSGDLIGLNKEEGLENRWMNEEEIFKEETFPGFYDDDELSWRKISPLKEQIRLPLIFEEKTRFLDKY